MKFFKWAKDGGPDSTVAGLYFIEVKSLFSVVLLRFNPGSRNAYHSHAFNSTSWLLSGKLWEKNRNAGDNHYGPSWSPIRTQRETFHKVISIGRSWALSFRGPWDETWNEYLPAQDQHVTLTNGRKEV